jgi:hypothetical protein
VADANVSVRHRHIAPFTATARLCGLLLLVAAAGTRSSHAMAQIQTGQNCARLDRAEVQGEPRSGQCQGNYFTAEVGKYVTADTK